MRGGRDRVSVRFVGAGQTVRAPARVKVVNRVRNGSFVNFSEFRRVLRQFRHLPFHTGMLNGQTALSTGSFPVWVSDADKFIDDGIFFGRYREGQTKI